MKRTFALAIAALLAAIAISGCAPGQAKRWFSPGHNKQISSER